ncbi:MULTISPECIES: murein biosynthesis integral membrane protein MurJ [unclassified Campylobacter]|uniref:murein biosynthesis integral membrane protein MurJ n=1 Tax=unclassified Campylobacter TaxID=2593542 RepID=UPI001237ECD0|nr:MULTISPECIES: murein biosynthesis integral membrane protein MurJ [unclassified Campylobacter]KAA6225355.1 murein biosynthesis integral membrane protein MurJ [Campylobacter sp. LR185c]KAA6227051.1 murein biosynthesis integral membrane protein MurJ [Campylobacter sp. LR196d]KAA6227622.1 murein biosynthesis integral membrane protein MurJ [Campylobacter sp. LR286c]KAA6230732.1 murein biosynthesis integral membrane protein MurJ [Campylobacter sp. LR291e]KAA8604953.1 murein biosynthesis integral 
MKSVIFKNFLINASGILFSRILGLARDVLLALFLGAGLFSDIFFVAIKMPAFFRRIFAEGAFGQSFLPNFVKAKKKGAFCFQVLIQFGIVVFLFCLLVSFFASFFTKIFAFGFDENTIKLAAPLVAINIWYLFFIFLVTFLAAILNYKQKFFITSFSASLFNLSIVIAAFFVDKNEPNQSLYYFSYATVLSGVAQLILHLMVLRSNLVIKAMFLAMKFKTKTKLNNFYANFFHGVLGSSATQLSSLLDTTIASFLITGSISYLYYANRVFQLPLALFAIAITQVSFPKILKHLKNKQEDLALNFMQKAFASLSILLIISSIIGSVFSLEISKLLFERGNFNEKDSLLTAYVLIAYLIGLLPFGLQKLFSLWLYARFKQKIAALIAFKALVLSFLCSISLIFLIEDEHLKVLAVALASSMSAFYLFFANIKEFGFKQFLSILSFKWVFIGVLGLILFGLLLFYLKGVILFMLICCFDFIKGMF